MAREAGASRGEEYLASVDVEGRACAARALPWSGLGAVTGLVVVAASARSVHEAVGGLPGRVLVLSGDAARPHILEHVLEDPAALGFAGLVLLVGDDHQVHATSHPTASVPVVGVGRLPDQEVLLRAVRVSLEVRDAPVGAAPMIPAPRHHRPRDAPLRLSSRDGRHPVPGTVDVAERTR